MANQRRNWEDRGKELAAGATDAVIAKLEEEFKAKQERLHQLQEELDETSVAQKLAEQSQLRQEINNLAQEISFARDLVKPAMVNAAGRAGRQKDPSKSCFP